VVDGQGRIYFVHTGVGVLTVGGDAKPQLYAEPGFHFLALDRNDRFTGQQWPTFPDGEIHVVGAETRLLLASSFPLVIGADGALYYPQAAEDGRVHLMRLVPSQQPERFATLPAATEIGPDGKPLMARWIHGLTAARDGSLYYTEQSAVRKVAADGTVSLVVGDPVISGCLRPPLAEHARLGLVLRGLDVADDGTLYVAASGCSAVLRIRPAGEVSVVLRASDAWAPTGIAVSGHHVYVLEFHHIPVQRAEQWRPRVRRLAPDGTVSIVATVD
jgi:serine/threonine-protein kinase